MEVAEAKGVPVEGHADATFRALRPGNGRYGAAPRAPLDSSQVATR
jgi:hypothetical protein